MTTITANSTIGITLSSPSYANPVVNAANIDVTTGIALTADFTMAWTVINHGVLESTDTRAPTPTVGVYSAGIDLESVGSVSNQSGGTIAGFDGIYGNGHAAETVVNAGTIDGMISSPSANYFGTGVYLGTGSSVVNESAGVISGTDGIHGGYNGFSIENAGRITGSVEGVRMFGGGTIMNDAAGTISGYFGISAVKGDLTVTNSGIVAGTPTSTHGVGIALETSGTISNQSAATISGYNGIYGLASANIVNSGSVAGLGAAGFGIYMRADASVTNSLSGSITGGSTGIDLTAGGTLMNAGTVSGDAGTAIALGGTGSNLLMLDPSFGFSGMVVGSSSATNTLELVSAASAGIVTGMGTEFNNFGSIEFDSGARWSIGGSTAALANGQVISGFTAADTIDLVGVSETVDLYSAGTLSLGGSAALDLVLPGSFTTAQFQATPSSDGTEITLACFLKGTRVLTAMGEVAVERLQVGMRVVSLLDRAVLPILWIGQQNLRETMHLRPSAMWPVRICAGAFAPGVPRHDLWLSPDHALFVGGVLIPVRSFVNGTSISFQRRDEVVYFHVELAAHGVLLAEGLPTESYLDTGNRSTFVNGRSVAATAGPDPRVTNCSPLDAR